MEGAGELVAQIRRELEGLDAEIRSHPYPEAVRQGRVGREALRAFPGHQYHIVSSDLRSVARLLGRCGQGRARELLAGMLEGEVAALERVVALGRRLGMDEEELRAYEPRAEGLAYATYVAWLASYGSAAEFAGALLVNLPAWGHNCGRLSAALRERYRFSPEDTAFLDAFAAMPSVEERALAVVQEGLEAGVEPGLIRRAARLVQGYEKMFWDCMLALAGSARQGPGGPPGRGGGAGR